MPESPLQNPQARLCPLDTNVWFSTANSTPPVGRTVLYRTARHQGMGSFEGDNIWRYLNGAKEKQPVLLWQPL